MTLQVLIKYRDDIKIVALASFFYASACVGHSLTFQGVTQMPTWPPSGIAFALLILLGRSAWPGIVVGSLLSNLMSFWNDGHLSVQTVVLISVMIASANTLQSLLGNWLVKRWIKDDYPFITAKNTFSFLFVTLLMTLVGGIIATFTLSVNGVISSSQVVSSIMVWVITNATGILLFTPFILSINYFMKLKFDREMMLQLVVLAVVSVAVIFLLRIDFSNTTLARAIPFLLIPVLLWLSFRFELLIVMATVVVVALALIFISTRNLGPFVMDNPSNAITLLQVYITVISVSTIVLAATVKERKIAERKLHEFTESLEANVLERTKALNEEINIRKQVEEKINRTNQELSKRNTELDNFVYSVSHDLRAPIASVLGLINLAKKDENAEMKDVYLDMIQRSANQQDHFIREILDQSRNSRLEIKREEIFFEPIIEETFDQLKFATATGQKVQKIIQVKQDEVFYSDRWRLKVILNNIISNSIRYRNGKDPVIKVNVNVNKAGATVEIEDNGKGIAKEHIDNVCKMFYRATDDGAGSGLGLYIVKETVDKLNGSLNIDSEVGRGTLVRLKIPEVYN